MKKALLFKQKSIDKNIKKCHSIIFKMKNLAFLLSFISLSAGQVFSQKVVTINYTPPSGTYVARDAVMLEPGFSFVGTSGNTFNAKTDHNIISELDYLSSIPDPETRALNTSYLVGATNGSFNVNPMGGASYSIPLEVPAGVNGLTPSLSIGYSSNSGTGVVGFGWQICGLSAITRGPQTFYNDGSASGVNLDANDRFYMDGQRLVTTNSYNYGDASALYQTDNDIITRVTPQATTTNGPGWFKAETKSGLVYEYGNSTDSKQVITGFSQVVNWYVSKVSDLFGNQANFAYIQDHYSIYPSEITYGPNNISFYYKQRTDKGSSFLKGVKIEQWLLLDKIVIKFNSKVVKSYEFKQSYQGSNYNSYSVLNEIIEYGIGSSRLNSTAISYKIPANLSFTQTNYNTTHQYVNYNSKLVPGDYNGDGKTDFLCIPDASKLATWSGIRVYFGDGNDNFPTYIAGANIIDLRVLKDIYSTDLNGNGKDDIVFEIGDQNNSLYYYILCDGVSLTSSIGFYAQAYGPSVGLFGKRRRMVENQQNDNVIGGSDFNGDGVNDLLIVSPAGDWRVLSFVNSTGQMTSTLNSLGNGTISSLATEVLSGDFNGDGKAEIWSFEPSQLKIYSFSGGTLNLLYTYPFASKQHFFTLGDFNGDGKVDLFMYGYGRDGTELDWTNWYVRFSTGVGFEDHSILQKKANLKDDYVRIGDFNGDGASDIMVTSGDKSWNGTYFYISENNGTDFYVHNIPYYPAATHNFSLGDFNGDGHTDFICTDGEPVWWTGYQVYRDTTSNSSILAWKIANGQGALTKVSYTKLSQASSSIYLRGIGATYPVTDFQGPLTVVSSVQLDNGKGTMNTQTYYYEGAKIHLQGKGFLGYSKTRTTDISTGFVNESTYGYSTTYFYPMLLVTTSGRSNDVVEGTNNIYSEIVLDASKKRIFPYIQNSSYSNYYTGLGTTSTFQYDNYGNPTSIQKHYLSGPTETTTNSYTNEIVDASHWLLGRPTISSIQYSGSSPTITRSGTRVFDLNNNHLTSETWYSGTNNQILKTYGYYPTGAPQSETATANGVPRTKSYTYIPDNIRIYTSTDQLGHVNTNSYDSYGRLLTQQDYLGNMATYQYDDMGRPVVVSSSDGNQTSTVYTWEDPTTDPVPARYSVLKTGNNGSQTKSWFDKLGREIRSGVKGFDGTMIYTTTVYNTIGQVESISEPYYSNGTALLNTFLYDTYGRKTNQNRPSGRNTTWVYSGSTITETTAGKSFAKTYSSDGTISTATDAGGAINYTYYNDGKVKTITAPGGIVTSIHYDIAGNQDQLVDPSAGTISYTYNGFGELTFQQNARSQTTQLNYLGDGRLDQKILSAEGTTTYSYNTNKQLTGISSPGSVNRSFNYDTKGRIISTTETIPGSSTFTTSVTYDDKGRNSTITHPSGMTETKNYNSNGYLYSISVDGVVKWTTNGMNARQQVTSGQYGNNLTATFGFDPYGYPSSTAAGTIQNYSYNFNPVTSNLNWRQNIKYTGLREDFHYDNLDRLDDVYMGSTMTLDMTYESNKGGIVNKSDVGTLLYNTSGKPYAVSSINPTTGLTPSASQTITYTSFESVSTISENNYNVSFTYNSDNERAKMVIQQNSSAILTRWYPSDNYIKETAGGVTKEYTFIGGDAYTAPVVAISQNGTPTWYYLLRDYLGNITHVVNATTATLYAEYSFDAWGRMRNPSTWANYTPGSEPALFIAGRGFTGHEHLPWFNLINMNGRVYDPLLGSFLSPDNNVQSPDFTQNFNRYGYCLNNPLKYSDPSGEFFFIIPNISWSPHGGLDISVTVGLGVPGVASVQATVGQCNNNFYGTVSVSLGGFNGYVGYGTKSGLMAGAGFGVSFIPGFSTNMTSVGINYSQNGGLSGNILGTQLTRNGFSFDPAVGFSHEFNNEKHFFEVQDGLNLKGTEMSENQVEDEFKSLTGVSEGEYKIGDITTSPGKGYCLTSDHVFAKSATELEYGYVARRLWSFKEIYDVHLSPYTTRDIYFLRGVITHEFRHVVQINEGWSSHFTKAQLELDACSSEILYYTSLPIPVFSQHNISGMIQSAMHYVIKLYK
jgi:RHS repeat-associated protein